ncbi:MAG: DUF4058 family protein [Fimbriiglobus sp.]
MPMHDWTRVPDGVYHHFHQAWIHTLAQKLNDGLLPNDLYALTEQVSGRFSPDVLTLQPDPMDETENPNTHSGGAATALQTRPKTRFHSEAERYRRKKSVVAVRHVSDDRIVAMIEIVSPGNKAGNHAIETFVRKSCDFLEAGVHLLILDPFPPGPRDPEGIHARIWNELRTESFTLPEDQRLTLVAYEADVTITRAYIEPIAVGDSLPDMPLFIRPEGYVLVPLEDTYGAAYAAQPQRWRRVIEQPPVA